MEEAVGAAEGDLVNLHAERKVCSVVYHFSRTQAPANSCQEERGDG